jgi:C4-type Zn-finger protein
MNVKPVRNLDKIHQCDYYPTGEVQIVRKRDGKEYFVCPNCKTKTHYYSRQLNKTKFIGRFEWPVTIWCEKCGMYGVQKHYR